MSDRIIVHEVSLDGYKVYADSKTLDFGTWGSYGIEKLHLTLGKAWEGLVITAHFNVKGEAVATALADVDNMIQVPWEATKENTFAGRIVFAGNMNGQRRLTANLNFKVTNHADYEASDPVPTDDKWNQFIAETKGYREDALAAANRALQSEQTSENAKQEVVNLGNEKQQEIHDLSEGEKQAISNLTDTKLKAMQDESAAQQAAITKKGADTLATIPEEYTQLNNDVSRLKEDFSNLSIDGIIFMRADGTAFIDSSKFCHGRINQHTGHIDKSIKYRIVNSTPISFSTPVELKPNDGFRLYFVWTSSDGTYHSAGWKMDYYKLTAGTNYYIAIARIVDDSDEIANIGDWVNQISLKNSGVLSDRIPPIEKNVIELYRNVFDFNLPQYWIDYLESKKTEITNRLLSIGGHGDAFLFFTDYHVASNEKHTANIIKWINKNTIINQTVFGGDILNSAVKKDLAISYLYSFASDFRLVYNIFGNHDGNNVGTSDKSLSLSKAERYSVLFSRYEFDDSVKNNKRDLYYYRDNQVEKIRYIYLNTSTSATQFVRDISQIAWFVSTLSSIPTDEWSVVVFMHIYFDQINSDYTLQESVAGERVRTILEAFNSKNKGSHTINTDYVSNSVDYDFTAAHGTTACVICGHSHNDYAMLTSNFPVICVTCDAIRGVSQNPSFERVTGTITEQALDTFFIDTTAKTINTVRIGSGKNRSFVYR